MRTNEAGFGLVEALVSTLITMVGVLAVVSLFLSGIRLQTSARDGAQCVNLATAELERLRMLPVGSPERADGGSLTADVAGHFAVRGNTTVRWVIRDGPACGPSQWAGPTFPVECTKDVSVAAMPRNQFAAAARLDGRLWR